MARKGDSQKSLAKLLGIGTTTIYNKFYGKTDWTISEVEALCDYFGKDYYELFK